MRDEADYDIYFEGHHAGGGTMKTAENRRYRILFSADYFRSHRRMEVRFTQRTEN